MEDENKLMIDNVLATPARSSEVGLLKSLVLAALRNGEKVDAVVLAKTAARCLKWSTARSEAYRCLLAAGCSAKDAEEASGIFVGGK